MRKDKPSLTVTCECGSEEFSVQGDVGGFNFELICNACGSVVATIPSYSINWVTEDEEGEDDDE